MIKDRCSNELRFLLRYLTNGRRLFCVRSLLNDKLSQIRHSIGKIARNPQPVDTMFWRNLSAAIEQPHEKHQVVCFIN